MSRPLKIFLIIFALIFSGAYLLLRFPSSFAENANEDSNSSPDANVQSATVKCPDEITDYLNEKIMKFGQFMQNLYMERKANSELIAAAVGAYGQTRASLRSYVEYSFSPDGDFRKKLSAELSWYQIKLPIELHAECQRTLEEDYLPMLDSLIELHTTVTASVKKTTQLSDKLASINEKLREMNRNVGLMQGYLGTFSQMIPCYIPSCQ